MLDWEKSIKDTQANIEELISEFSYLDEANEEWFDLKKQYEDLVSQMEFSKKFDYRLDIMYMSFFDFARKETNKMIYTIRHLIHENKLTIANEEFLEVEKNFKDLISEENDLIYEHSQLQEILTKLEQIIQHENEVTTVESSTKSEDDNVNY